MEKRKYTKIQVLEPEIVAMQEGGKTHREIAEHFGLERDQVKKCLKSRRIRQQKQATGIQPKPKGRPARMASRRIKAQPQSLSGMEN